jgi:hypothetical protein
VSRAATVLKGAIHHAPPRDFVMLWTLFTIFMVLWIAGLVTAHTLGGFIHILLVVAIAVLLIQLTMTGRQTV